MLHAQCAFHGGNLQDLGHRMYLAPRAALHVAREASKAHLRRISIYSMSQVKAEGCRSKYGKLNIRVAVLWQVFPDMLQCAMLSQSRTIGSSSLNSYFQLRKIPHGLSLIHGVPADRDNVQRLERDQEPRALASNVDPNEPTQFSHPCDCPCLQDQSARPEDCLAA